MGLLAASDDRIATLRGRRAVPAAIHPRIDH
jgi:hypothetical protein